VIAYIEGGINWQADPRELANRVFLNRGELPRPTTPKRDGQFNALDFADTKDRNGNEVVDPEDLIVRYSDGVDDDRNGYVDDISGWDFYNDQNDPTTLDTAYDHANNQMKDAAAETNNGFAEAGICPKCMLLPIKAGAEALDRTDDLAQAWLYAADIDADVIVSSTADLGYSSFMRDAVDYIWRRGTVMVESSNDFDSTDHQGGMFHAHVLPGNGLVANTHGLERVPGSAPVQNALTTTYRARSGYTSWGTHNMFSIAAVGGTTSESTPHVGGVMAIVIAYGKEAARRGKIKRPLSASEAVQVVRATASDIAANPNPPLQWPAKPGWDLQFGYGRPNVYKAMQAISKNRIPPEAWFNGPRWYSLYDPHKTRRVRITGHVAAPRSRSYRWVLQYAPGGEPDESEFKTLRRGKGNQPFNGTLGVLNLERIPRSFWSAAFRLSSSKTLETNEQYTVTLRVRVFDRKGRMGEERRSIAVHYDPTWRRGFPRFIGPGGEAGPALADLQGRGRLAIVFGDADGRIHAIDPRGHDLPGFPVFTNRTEVVRPHEGVDPGHEPILTGGAVGDLFGDGRQWIVATSSTGRTYVWDSRGHRLRGWPKAIDTGVRRVRIPRPHRPFTRQRIMGATAPPVLVDLDRDRRLEIVQAGWDGHLHAWDPGGSRQPGWPVKVTLPPWAQPSSGLLRINDQKLDLPPTVAELDGDPRPELVQKTQYSFTSGAGLKVGDGSTTNVIAYNHDGSRVPDFLISTPSIAFYYGSAQEFITEGTQVPSAADVDGDGRTELASAPGIFSPTALHNPDGSLRTAFGPSPGNLVAIAAGDAPLQTYLDILNGSLPDDVPVNFTTSGAWGRFGNQLVYAEPGTGGASVIAALLTPGSGSPINNYIRAFTTGGASLPGMPSKIQGLDFLGAPTIADVSGDGEPEILVGGDSSALHAFRTGGGQAPRFPKFHTGWVVFGLAPGDLDGDGRVEVVTTTREGYLMVWNTPGRASANDQWWNHRHDERNTGNYGIDTRPPGVARKARLSCGRLSFRAPGDDWYAGRARIYRIRYRARDVLASLPVRKTVEAGRRVTLNLPATALAIVRAEDEAGNVGARRVVRSTRGGCPG
jgi:hypothetical protein